MALGGNTPGTLLDCVSWYCSIGAYVVTVSFDRIEL